MTAVATMSHPGPKISIITVCFNSAKTIACTLQSVAEQTWPNIEHIVVDGASSDGTLNVIEQNGSHVARLISEPDKGIYDAMNKGIAAATGDVIGFINADDFYASPDVLKMVAAAFSHQDVNACYGDLCYVRQEDTSALVRYWKSSGFQAGAFERGWCPPHPTFFVRRTIYERFGSFNLGFRIAADVELMMRFLEVHQIRAKYIPYMLVKMRMGGTTNRSWSNIVKQNVEVLRALKIYGLRSSFLPFAARKLICRGKQFLTRPSQGPVDYSLALRNLIR